MLTRRSRRSQFLAGGLFLVLAAGCGSNEDSGNGEAASEGGQDKSFSLQLATYTGPQAADNLAYEKWAERVKELTEGTVEIELLRQGSLLAAPDILPGVASGRADLGGTSYIYHPAELPLSHVVNVPYQGENLPAESAAFKELYESNDAYRAEFESQGVHLLFNMIVGPPLFGCKEPVKSLDDLKGRDVRVGGLVAAAWEPIGVNVVTVPAPEIRESIERGLIDCWAGIPLDVVPDFGLEEITPYIYDSGYENYGTFHLVVNKSVWDDFSDAQRSAMEQASDEVLEQIGDITDTAYAAACKKIESAAKEFERLPDSVVAEWRELAEERVLKAYYDLTKKAGKSGEEFFKAYRETLEKKEAESPDYVSAITRCQDGQL